jgi:hypothetical protein
MRRNLGIFGLCLAVLFVAYNESIFSGTVFPIRDSLIFHYIPFHLMANGIATFGKMVEWFPANGGWPAAMGLPSFYFFLPYRWLGWQLYLITHGDSIVIFKLAMTAGLAMVAAPWWKALQVLGVSRRAATVGTLCFLLGGVGQTVFHQEQVLATVFWYPFLILAYDRWRKGEGPLAPVLVFCGISLCNHLPVIHFYTILALALLTARPTWAALKAYRPGKLGWGRDLLWGCVALVPIVLILAWLPQYQSPIRVDGIISASNLDDYIKLNRQQVASTPFSYFQSFLLPGSAGSDPGAPVINTSDAWLYFLPRLGLLLALAGIVVGVRRNWKAVALVLGLGLASTGVEGGVAQTLFTLHLPGISAFRQWYHFGALFVMGMSFLSALGFDWVANQTRVRSMATGFWMVCLVGIGLDGVWVASEYRDVFGGRQRPSRYAHMDPSGWSGAMSGAGTLSLFAVRETDDFLKKCSAWKRKDAVVFPAEGIPAGDCPAVPEGAAPVGVFVAPSSMKAFLSVNAGVGMVVFPVAHLLVRTATDNGAGVTMENFHDLAAIRVGPGQHALELNVVSWWQRLSWAALWAAMGYALFGVRLRRAAGAAGNLNPKRR